ncbi:MAG: thymidine phosphorylase [Candidatus Heimdallarchaeum endolithica]|uniref:Thymidine phosphorylase n=1 Tax=Candidatus Heimdallarchaeum endolithica TaxID=2876572 RepID=A0A9Y1FQ99_9ARCH|nr:MAG: thymidine phosphorylase [Candidatus Heimdallarchaeum endolithica]
MIIKIEPSLDNEPYFALINSEFASKYSLHPGQLVEITPYNVGMKLRPSETYPPNTLGISQKASKEFSIRGGDEVEIREIINENIIHIIHKKMKGTHLNENEINMLFSAIDKNLIHPSQIAVLMSLFEVVGLSMDETTSVAKAIINNSRRLIHKNKPVVDKHSIGGIAGNRITPIMIPILASAGLTIPKISTRAITSPAGTIDTVELLMPCDLTLSEMSEVVEKTGGCVVSGENVGLADVTDKIIHVLDSIKIDPKEFMVASILSKKIVAGSEYVLIDLPTGKGAKVSSREKAKDLGRLFTSIGTSLKLQMDCIISPGDRPIGSMIGPSLEAIDVLKILKNQLGSNDLMNKAVSLSGIILEAQNLVPRGSGHKMALGLLKSGKAYEKFKEIVEAQGGNPEIKVDDIPRAKYIEEIKATQDGVIYAIDSASISTLARQAGAPFDKTAGVKILVKRGDRVKKGDTLFEIHSSSASKLSASAELARTKFEAIDMEKMILEVISGPKEM